MGESKRGADRGIDGKIPFSDEAKLSAKTKSLLFSVKAENVGVSIVRDLVGVLARGAVMGVLMSLNEPTGPMRAEAASAGRYDSPMMGTSHPRVQLVTVAELLEGRKLDLPRGSDYRTFKQSPKAKGKDNQATIAFETSD